MKAWIGYVALGAVLLGGFVLTDAAAQLRVAEQHMRQQVIHAANREPAEFVRTVEGTLDTYNNGIIDGITRAINGHDWPSPENRQAFVSALMSELNVTSVDAAELNQQFVALFLKRLGLDSFDEDDPKLEARRRLRDLLRENFENGVMQFEQINPELVPKE